MSSAADERLARRARRGDERAFTAIFERYHQRLYRYCMGILANPEDAQDALQNTMVKALRALPGEERSISLKPWLYRIAHNESIDLLRRRRVTEPVDPDSLPEGLAVAETAQIGVAERVEIRERLGRLLSDLHELPDRQRGALLMRELSDLSFEEIAASFDTSPGVARQTVYEARLSLRQMGEGREMSCDEVMRAISDGDRRVLRRKDIRSHLRTCKSCAGFEAEIANRHEDLAAISPIPALAAAGILGGLLGGGGGGAAAAGGAAAGGAAAAGGGLGSSAAATLASSAALKAAATVAVVAALGTAAADRSGLIHVGGTGGDTSSSKSGPAGTGGATGGSSIGAGSGTGQGAPGQAANGEPGAHPRGSHAGAGWPAKAGEQASEPGAPGSSPYGKATGHGKSPSSSAGNGGSHGAKGNRGHGSGGSNAHPEHPPKPPHPAHPEQAHPPKPPQPAHPVTPGAVSGSSEATPPAGEGAGAGRAQGQGAAAR